MRQQIRLIDTLASGHVDNVSDIPRLSTNEKAGVGGVAAESGRMKDIELYAVLRSSLWNIDQTQTPHALSRVFHHGR